MKFFIKRSEEHGNGSRKWIVFAANDILPVKTAYIWSWHVSYYQAKLKLRYLKRFYSQDRWYAVTFNNPSRLIDF